MPVTLNSALQVLIFLVIVLLLTRPVGLYLYKVFNGERTWLSPVFVPVERLFYRLSGIDPEEEQKWLVYAISYAVFCLKKKNNTKQSRRNYLMTQQKHT